MNTSKRNAGENEMSKLILALMIYGAPLYYVFSMFAQLAAK